MQPVIKYLVMAVRAGQPDKERHRATTEAEAIQWIERSAPPLDLMGTVPEYYIRKVYSYRPEN